MNMRTLIAISMLFALITTSGCWNTSSQGGTAPVNEEFSITVPSSITIIQGETATATATLNRGAYFKRDVQLNITTDSIGVTPGSILVKASDKPDVQIKITVPKNAALGEYRVSIKGTPATGQSTTTAFTVKVVAQ